MQTKPLYAKYYIEHIRQYYFCENGELWREPYVDANNGCREWRKITKQNGNRWRINGEYYSIRQLTPKIKRLEKLIKINEVILTPF
jgi:hypothetical protein